MAKHPATAPAKQPAPATHAAAAAKPATTAAPPAHKGQPPAGKAPQKGNTKAKGGKAKKKGPKPKPKAPAPAMAPLPPRKSADRVALISANWQQLAKVGGSFPFWLMGGGVL